jgi:hypothetical protein
MFKYDWHLTVIRRWNETYLFLILLIYIKIPVFSVQDNLQITEDNPLLYYNWHIYNMILKVYLKLKIVARVVRAHVPLVGIGSYRQHSDNDSSPHSFSLSSICGWDLAECGWDLAECGWDLAVCGWDLADCEWDLAEWLERSDCQCRSRNSNGLDPMHPRTQWNLRGGKWRSVEYST